MTESPSGPFHLVGKEAYVEFIIWRKNPFKLSGGGKRRLHFWLSGRRDASPL
jgi:hypothetical protein